MDYDEFQAKAIGIVQEEGGRAAIDFYREHRGNFETIPLRGKLELLAAIEKKHNLLGTSVQVKDGESPTTEDLIDHIIEINYHALGIFERVEDIPSADAYVSK